MSDVASLYTSMMIEYNCLSRNVPHPEIFKQIRDKRIELKRAKNPMQKPYKIVLNSTYGASKDKFNQLFDPLMANNVCITGQLLILDLIEKLELAFGDNCELVQSNTDGILFKVNSEENKQKYLEECAKWSKRTRLNLEHDEYVKVVQKDVNNYIIIDAKGKYKSKGAYVKKLNDMGLSKLVKIRTDAYNRYLKIK
jgi:DNA polymerase elongation subunit (family B)